MVRVRIRVFDFSGSRVCLLVRGWVRVRVRVRFRVRGFSRQGSFWRVILMNVLCGWDWMITDVLVAVVAAAESMFDAYHPSCAHNTHTHTHTRTHTRTHTHTHTHAHTHSHTHNINTAHHTETAQPTFI